MFHKNIHVATLKNPMQHSHGLTMIELSKNFYFKSEEKGQERDGVISEEGERP